MYNVRYILVQDGAGEVIADTFTDVAQDWLVKMNPPNPAGTKHCEPWKSSKDEKIYFDCAVPIKYPKGGMGAVRAGISQQNPQSPFLEKLKTAQLSGIFRKPTIIAILLVILFSVLCILAFWYFMLRRIKALTDAAERMSFGDLETIVPIKSQDEIGVLEDTLERMRMNLKDAIERLKRRK
jgi:HAMP domain-containing protein